MRVVQAFRTLDCARKARIRYFLPEPLDERLLLALGEGSFERRAFSALVAGARDHLSWTAPDGRVRAAGVAGDNVLVVTFGKLDGEVEDDRIEAVGARLAEHCGATLEERREASGPSGDAPPEAADPSGRVA